MLSERSQTQKTIYCAIPFIRHSGKTKTVKTKNSSMVGRSWPGGRDDGKGAVEGNSEGDNTVLYINCDGNFTTGCICQSSQLLCMLKRGLHSTEIIPQ